MKKILVVIAASLYLMSPQANAQTITGAGATFPFPIYSKWSEAYKEKANIELNYQSIGSSGGIKQIKAATVDFGATDAPMKGDELTATGLVQFPTVLGGVVPIINVEGIKPGELQLTGEVLADIYLGTITHWNDAKIAALNPKMSIGAAIMEPLEAHNILKTFAERKEKALELLAKVGLQSDCFLRLPHEFSGGERQRICIARALALNPKILICDESVSALDVSIQAQIINLLNDLKIECRFSLIFISHDIQIVRYVSDRMLVLHNGEAEELNEADALCNHPQKEYTQQLLAAVPKGTVEEYFETQQKKKSILTTYDN